MSRSFSVLKHLFSFGAFAATLLATVIGCATPAGESSLPAAVVQDSKAPAVSSTRTDRAKKRIKKPSSQSVKSGSQTEFMPGESGGIPDFKKIHKQNKDAAIAAVKSQPGMHSVTAQELASLKAINESYRTAKSVAMDVTKQVKLGLIGSERKSSGKLFLSKGQLRMELEGAEKTLLVVNKKNLYAVTYPDPQLKGAAIQVIKGETASKKARSQALTSLLGSGGFLKSFKATALQVMDDGEKIYFLQPTNNQSEFTRAQFKVSQDGKEIRELHYWDARDNETILILSNIKFGTKIDPKLFTYAPPADADVMNL